MPVVSKRSLLVLLTAAVAAGGSGAAWAGGASGPGVSGARASGPGTSGATMACAASEPRKMSSARPGADSALVPDGAVNIVLCRYDGLNDRPRRGLVGHQEIADQRTVTSLASAMNALPELGNIDCPADFGDAIVAYFTYASGPAASVSVGLSGCETVTNGQLTRTARKSDLVARLERLVPRTSGPPPARNATITGYVRLCGGPAPGRCWKGSIGSCSPGQGCVTTDRIAVIDDTGATVARARLRHGRFTVRVPAGRYRVELLSDGRHVHGRIVATRAVTAVGGQTATVKFQFDVP